MDESLVKVIHSSGNDLTCVNAARISFQKESAYIKANVRLVRDEDDENGRTWSEDYDLVLPEADKKLLKYLLKNKHFSVFEHCSITFWVKAPIFVLRQWMRHKSWSFNEISGRYVELDPFYYVPPCFRPPHDTNRQGSKDTSIPMDRHALIEYKDACDFAINTYHNLLDRGVCREQARMVLPLSLYSEIYATANLRSILHFLEQRLDPHAQLEIQEYAKEILKYTKELFPEVISIWEELRNA